MIYKTDEEVKSLVGAFEERTLTKAEWTHAAHLTVGLCYCLNYHFAIAKNLMSDGIYLLNDAHGTLNTDSSGYHETLTMFWLLTIKEFVDNTECGERRFHHRPRFRRFGFYGTVFQFVRRVLEYTKNKRRIIL